jgi:hypothetical protein
MHDADPPDLDRAPAHVLAAALAAGRLSAREVGLQVIGPFLPDRRTIAVAGWLHEATRGG